MRFERVRLSVTAEKPVGEDDSLASEKSGPALAGRMKIARRFPKERID
jgi:hypothetical protein